MRIDLTIFKAYDVRGIYPDQVNEEVVYKIGRAFVEFLKADKVIVGRDARLSSPALFKALAKGIIEQGADLIEIGLISADAFYFASGKLGLPGLFISASHNPAQWNGLKFCCPGAEPTGQESGLEKIKELVIQNKFPQPAKQGRIVPKDILKDYTKHVLSFIDSQSIRPLKIVIDAGNGMAGKIIPLVFKHLPVQIIPLYFELDGSFPHHPANPIESANLVDSQRKIQSTKADLGIAFDGDADRVFFIDEQSQAVKSSLIIALLSKKILEKYPGEKIIYDLTCSWLVPEVIKQYGGLPIIERTGYTFIKQTMKKVGAIFGGEDSGHYYFRDNFGADSGLIAALIILEIISQANQSFSQILEPFKKYYAVEETNFQVQDKEGVIDKLERKYQDGKTSHLDGLTIEYPDWWFNLRPSNTEPLIRLNLEAKSGELMEEKFKEVSQLIKEK